MNLALTKFAIAPKYIIVKVTCTENAVLLEISMRKVADNLWQASLLDDPELTSIGGSPGVAREELKYVVSLALGLPSSIILFTTGEAPFGGGNSTEVPSHFEGFDEVAARLRRSRNNNRNIAREAIRNLIVDDCLTLAQAAEFVGISPLQVAALVED